MPAHSFRPDGHTAWQGLLTATLLSPALVLGPGLLSAPASAQGLIDVTGAAALQGTVNSIAVPGATTTLNRVQQTTSAIQATTDERAAATLAPMGPSLPPPAGAPAGGATAAGRLTAPPPPPTSLARVNGQSVPVCSHGGLCHGALLRAMGIR